MDAPATEGYDFLRAGDWINARGGFLQSQDGRLKLSVQTDGNMCVYANNAPPALWCSLKNSLNPNYCTIEMGMESKGLMKKFYTPLASAGEKANPTTFPNQASCTGIGELAFQVAEKLLTRGISAEVKAAQAAGKSNTVAMVADQLRTVYKVAAAGAKYDDIVRELDTLPECK